MTDPLLAAIRAVPVRCADCGLLSNMEALAGSPPCQPPRLGDRRRGDNAVQAVLAPEYPANEQDARDPRRGALPANRQPAVTVGDMGASSFLTCFPCGRRRFNR